jgi:hypothetical protein
LARVFAVPGAALFFLTVVAFYSNHVLAVIRLTNNSPEMATLQIPTANEIAGAQALWTIDWHAASVIVGGEGFLRLAAENHARNFNLWHEEDIARRDDLGAASVMKSKRAIDRFNQERNDFVERMDKALVEALKPQDAGPFNSETPGMIIDRLSILALKEYHMREQVERTDVAAEHREKCAFKLDVIRRQRADLTAALMDLLDGVREGRRSFRVYFQFKMYNDPSLNPQLYKGAKS